MPGPQECMDLIDVANEAVNTRTQGMKKLNITISRTWMTDYNINEAQNKPSFMLLTPLVVKY